MKGKEKQDMKSLGTIRHIDELGRIVLPVETRKRLDLNTKDPVEVFVEKDRIILKKFEPACVFCGERDDLVDYKEKKICKKCLDDITRGV